MSSSGLIYAMIVGAWAAYLVPMWLRRQDELNEARPTERFSTAIRLLTGRGQANRAQGHEDSGTPDAPGAAPASADEYPDAALAAPPAGGVVDVRSAAVPVTDPRGAAPASAASHEAAGRDDADRDGAPSRRGRRSGAARPAAHGRPDAAATAYAGTPGGEESGRSRASDAARHGAEAARAAGAHDPEAARGREAHAVPDARDGDAAPPRTPGRRPTPSPAASPAAGSAPTTAERRARARVLARRRRVLTLLFFALTGGAVAAAVGGPGYIWAAAIPGLLLTAYVVRVRTQERRRRTYTADPSRAEAAARRLREDRDPRAAPPHPARPGAHGTDGADVADSERTARGGRTPRADRAARGSQGGRGSDRGSAEAAHDGRPGASRAHGGRHDRHTTADHAHDRTGSARPDAIASGATIPAPADGEAADAPAAAAYEADRRALVEQTDHAEWVDQQRERSRPADAGWDPVPVPLPTYVTAPVAPRATRGLDLDAPDTWSSARSSTAEPTPAPSTDESHPDQAPSADEDTPRRPRDRGRTPLFDQYADPNRRRAANE